MASNYTQKWLDLRLAMGNVKIKGVVNLEWRQFRYLEPVEYIF